MTVSTSDLALAEKQIVHDYQTKEKVTNEEFKLWKKLVPVLYDYIHTHALEYSSLAVKWLDGYSASDDGTKIRVRFLYGTNTSLNAQDYVKLGELEIPATLAPDYTSKISKNGGRPLSVPLEEEYSRSPLNIVSLWPHPGEVNCLRVAPNGTKFLTFDNRGLVHMFHVNSSEDTEFNHHKLEGYALEWIDNDKFLSGANDSQIALWDVSKPSTPIQLFKTHDAVINDISYNHPGQNIFGSVSDDYSTQIHDIRVVDNSSHLNPVIKLTNSHIQNSFQFHPEIKTIFAQGGKDNIVSIYDMRNTSKPVRKLFGHTDSVYGILWDKHNHGDSIYSWGLDRRVITWDLNNLDEEFVYPTDVNENSRRRNNVSKVDPCLKFIHGGHTNRVSTVDIHPQISDLVISVGDDTLLEVFKPKHIFDEEEEDEEEEEEDEKDEEDEKVPEVQDEEHELQNTKEEEPIKEEKEEDSESSVAKAIHEEAKENEQVKSEDPIHTEASQEDSSPNEAEINVDLGADKPAVTEREASTEPAPSELVMEIDDEVSEETVAPEVDVEMK